LGLTDVSGEHGNLTDRTAITVDGQGRWWIALDSLNVTKLVKIAPDGTLLPTTLIGHNPVSVAASSWGTVYAATRVPLSFPGPLYAVSSAGSVLWSSWKGPGLFKGAYAEYPALGSDGSLWLGGYSSFACPGCGSKYLPVLVRMDPANGVVLNKLVLPQTGPFDTVLMYMAAAPDGTLWTLQTGNPVLAGNPLVNTDDSGVLKLHPVQGGTNGVITQIRVDAAGDVWTVNPKAPEQGNLGSKLLLFSGDDGSLLAAHDLEGLIVGYALGASGEDIVAVVNDFIVPGKRRLVRVSLVTGRRSSRPFESSHTASVMANGDPTGFIYANVVDQLGDNDGDGAANRVETLAGSSPYDPLSRPEGPKVYLDFTANDAIILTFKDPDGLLDPAGGLDVGSISVTAGRYGEIFPFLLSFLTFVQVSPDLTEATAVFGALPLAAGLKLTLDVRVADRTGAVGWDWQVTPPGEL
jgi:hypothetical protein